MAQIVINEISQNYTYNIGTHSFATVAMPITSCWGPGYFDPESYYGDTLGSCEDPREYMLEHTAWQRFPATQAGLEAFVAAYRGPASVYRRAKDFSYQMAMTLLTAGYDVLVCRMCPGSQAQGQFKQQKQDGSAGDAVITLKAKYPGTFGNNIQVTFKKNIYFDSISRTKKIYWNVITHVVDASGVKTSVENLSMVFNMDNSNDSILHYSEIESQFWFISVEGEVDEGDPTDPDTLNAVKTPYPVMYDLEGNEIQIGSKPVGISANVEVLHYVRLAGGDDIQKAPTDGSGNPVSRTDSEMKDLIKGRYEWAKMYNTGATGPQNDYDKYPNLLTTEVTIKDDQGQEQTVKLISQYDPDQIEIFYYKEWLYTHLVGLPVANENTISSTITYEGVFDLLKDKLAYNPQRIISSGWDDQDYTNYLDDFAAISRYVLNGTLDEVEEAADCPDTCMLPVSPLHLKIMDVAYYGRCATGLIDIPRVVDRKYVHIEDETNLEREGYVQKLARVIPYNAALDVNGSLFHTHSALFAPWGQYIYVGTGKMNTACPSFLALMIQRAQILNQPIQYEWALPTNRRHNLRIGKMDYSVPKKLLDKWQKLDGASLNIITSIPDMGTNLWGNSTLFEVPPVTYQALANLSTRYLVNAVEDLAYKCGIGITFQYNNDQAYNKFYAGVTPLLDTMKNVGAIDDYYVKMAADINGLDHVNANTVIGKIYLVINGVINDIIVDLIALPPGVDLDQFRN